MKRTIYILIFTIIVTFLSSCIDVIELNLKDTEPRIVIEATLDATDSTCHVIVTQTNDFYDNNIPIRMENLNIVLSKTNSDESYNLHETIPGDYQADNIIATPGDEFSITVTDNEGNTYTAKAVTPSMSPPFELFGFSIPFFVLFTSITEEDITYIDDDGNEVTLLFALTYWLDVPGEENYYRFKIFEDGEYQPRDYNFVDDGSATGDTLQSGLNTPFKMGDTIVIQLLSINKETYDYFDELIEVLYSGMNSTTPFNPHGNFDNGALGYFCIQQVQEQELIVEKFPF
ncbi:MAG: DUF4249 domain-containing protein [Bacteroidales bacterium]|nr:DUF4249 domain-containing protein [Bacteroidales bacterium]